MPCYPFHCNECGHHEPDLYVPRFESPSPFCEACDLPMERWIGLPVANTAKSFADGEGRFFNKSADEWQDRSQHRAWQKKLEKEGWETGPRVYRGKRNEREHKIGDKISKYGPAYAKEARLQYQQGSEKKRLDIV